MWQDRIIGFERRSISELGAHPKNARKHPEKQREALRGSLDTLGWYDAVIYNQRTGYLIDGHARLEEAIAQGADTVPTLIVDLEPHEEAQALASHDFISRMAEYDRSTLDDLLRDVQSDDDRVQALLSELAEDMGVILPDEDTWGDAFAGLPDEDRAPFQQMTFTLHDDQAETVREAVKLSASLGDYGETGNENGNGNALARICEVFITQNG